MTVASSPQYEGVFGDGTIGSWAILQRVYPSAGTYTAMITAANLVSQGSADTRFEIIPLNYELYLPPIYSNKSTLSGHSQTVKKFIHR